MSDLAWTLLFLGVGAAAVLLPRVLEAESVEEGLLRPQAPPPHALKRLFYAHVLLLFFTLPLYLRVTQAPDPAGFLWFWARTAGFSQLLYLGPAWLCEKDAAERRRLLAAGKIAAAASTAAAFAGLSQLPGPVARSAAASMAAISAALYGFYVASRLRR